MGTSAFIQDESEFDSLLPTEPLLIVDCTATWNELCQLVASLMHQLAKEYGDHVKVLRLDMNADRKATKRFGIKNLLAVMFLKLAKTVEALVGVKPYEEFSSTMHQLL